MIILEGGSRPEKQDEAPPLPASLPTHSVLRCFAANSPEISPMRPVFLPRFD